MKKVVVGAHSAEEVEERVFPSGQQYHRQAFAASQSYQIPGLSFLVAVKKSEIDGKEEEAVPPISMTLTVLERGQRKQTLGAIEGHGDNSLQVESWGRREMSQRMCS